MSAVVSETVHVPYKHRAAVCLLILTVLRASVHLCAPQLWWFEPVVCGNRGECFPAVFSSLKEELSGHLSLVPTSLPPRCEAEMFDV